MTPPARPRPRGDRRRRSPIAGALSALLVGILVALAGATTASAQVTDPTQATLQILPAGAPAITIEAATGPPEGGSRQLQPVWPGTTVRGRVRVAQKGQLWVWYRKSGEDFTDSETPQAKVTVNATGTVTFPLPSATGTWHVVVQMVANGSYSSYVRLTDPNNPGNADYWIVDPASPPGYQNVPSIITPGGGGVVNTDDPAAVTVKVPYSFYSEEDLSVAWNGVPLPTTPYRDDELNAGVTVAVPYALRNSPGIAALTVRRVIVGAPPDVSPTATFRYGLAPRGQVLDFTATPPSFTSSSDVFIGWRTAFPIAVHCAVTTPGNHVEPTPCETPTSHTVRGLTPGPKELQVHIPDLGIGWTVSWVVVPAQLTETPPPVVRVVRTVQAIPTLLTTQSRGVVRFQALRVHGLTPGTRIAWRCLRGCTARGAAVARRASIRLTSPRLRNRKLSAGTTIEVRATRAGDTGTVVRITLTKSGARRFTVCSLPSGSTRPRNCRAS